MKQQQRYQEGHWLSIGSGFGIMFGLLIGIPFDNSAISLLVGVVIGLIFGYALEKKFNPNPIKLTPKQRRLKIIMAIIVIIIAFLVAFFIFTNTSFHTIFSLERT